MRRLIVSLAAAGTVLAFATPASAQWAPRPGYDYNRGHDRDNIMRWRGDIAQIRGEMDRLNRYGRLSRNEAIDLNNDIRSTERSIYASRRDGLQPWESRQIEQRIKRLYAEVRRYSDYDGRRGDWRRGNDRGDWHR